MNLCYWNVVQDGNVERSPWGSPWLCSVERAIAVAERLADRVQLYPVKPPVLSLEEQVAAYARAHYDTGGWDVIVETMSLADIRKDLVSYPGGGPTAVPCLTIEQVLTDSILLSCVSIWDDRQADARNSAF